MLSRFRRLFVYLFFVAVALLLVCIATAVPVPPHSYFAEGDFLVIAHRGGRGLMPENTLEAFGYADSLGVDVLEMDLRASADGHLVIMHDATVDRTTNGSGRIDSLTLAQIEALDAGYRWQNPEGSFPFRGKGVRIPTLDTVLSSFRHKRLLIEIKPDSPEISRQFCATLSRFKMDQRTIVASFHSDALNAFRSACPQTPISATAGQVGLYTALHLLHLEAAYPNPPIAFQVPTHLGPLNLVDDRFIASVHARNAQVHVWTINREETMRQLVDLGVDGLITDYPDRLLRVLKRPPNEREL